jgi:hypothetical protein
MNPTAKDNSLNRISSNRRRLTYPPYLLVLEKTGHQYGELISSGRRFLLNQGFDESDADRKKRLVSQAMLLTRPHYE